MDIDTLTTFRKVASVGSISKAAAELYVAIGTVTGRIRMLEKELGKPLFVRAGRKISLTDDGEQFLKYVDHFLTILELGEQQMNQLRESHTGQLDIAVSEMAANYILPELLTQFKTTYPQIQLHFIILPDYLVVDKVMGGKVELGVVDQSFSGLASRLWYSNRMVPVVFADHPLLQLEKVSPDQLKQYPLVSYSARTQEEEKLKQWLAEHGDRRQPAIRIQHLETLKLMLPKLRAITFIPHISILTEEAQGDLSTLSMKERPRIGWDTSFIHRPNLQLSLAAKTFLSFSEKYVRELGIAEKGGGEGGLAPNGNVRAARAASQL